MKSTWPVDPRLRKLPRGTSITTSSSGAIGSAWRPPGRLSASWFTAKDYTLPDQATAVNDGDTAHAETRRMNQATALQTPVTISRPADGPRSIRALPGALEFASMKSAAGSAIHSPAWSRFPSTSPRWFPRSGSRWTAACRRGTRKHTCRIARARAERNLAVVGKPAGAHEGSGGIFFAQQRSVELFARDEPHNVVDVTRARHRRTCVTSSPVLAPPQVLRP